MPDMVTLRELISTFTEQELDMTVPFDFKNPTADTIEYANKYNAYLAVGDYQGAYEYRVANADILEPMIHDAKALNKQQAIMINTYLAVKDVKSDNSKDVTLEEYEDLVEAGSIEENTTYYVEDERDFIEKSGYELREVTTLPSDAAQKPKTIFIVK